MLWMTRDFGDGGWVDIRATFEDQFEAFGRPRDMMLIAVSLEDGRHRLCIGLPDPELLAAYYGFAPVLRVHLPSAPTLLVGHQDVFQAMFQCGG
ncbi:hypothetical protein [Methylobacterium sp. J-068]|uniref:hypothetical protein n=1 Tax=Methylobacterium sp. J-068 TaxID=2836649 RepID=UPI001FB96370|nr:hypothetical protein [Methylobacterium sp. J-068]MCJ2035152.1 hypothetical protein [Methylobacterium sp. J-068]